MKPTSLCAPPAPGTAIRTVMVRKALRNEMIYYALDNETPKMIALKFEVSLEDFIAANKKECVKPP